MGALAEALCALYRSEINCGLSSFWDGGWDVWIGDDMNGYAARQQFLDEDFDQIAPWLLAEAKRIYPESDLARAGRVPGVEE